MDIINRPAEQIVVNKKMCMERHSGRSFTYSMINSGSRSSTSPSVLVQKTNRILSALIVVSHLGLHSA